MRLDTVKNTVMTAAISRALIPAAMPTAMLTKMKNQRVKGVAQRPAELHARNNTRKTESQCQAVLHDDNDAGNDARQDQGCLVQGVIMFATAVYGPRRQTIECAGAPTIREHQ